MNIDIMRWIDHNIGRMLCFFIRIFDILFGRLFIRQSRKPKNVLLIELSEMGSTIIAYSMISKLKNNYDNIYFMIFKNNKESLTLLELIPEQNIITIRDNNLLLFTIDTIRSIIQMWEIAFDIVIDMELFSRFTAMITYLSRSPVRVGFYKFHLEGLYRGNLLTHNVSYNPYMHMSRNFLSLAYSINSNKDIPLLKKDISNEQIATKKIVSSNEENERMLNKLKHIYPTISKNSKIILLNPDASKLLPIRKWPLHYYCLLAEMILKKEDNIVVITGLETDIPTASKICNFVKTNERCINFAGRTSNIRELIHLYNISDILITNDSGPGQFASMTNIPQIVFFGPETPVLYAPLDDNVHVMYSHFACSPCVSAFNHRKTVCKDSKCLEAITVEEVYNKVHNIFNNNI
jgi:ADP-heptose:LPS heptosyltransferase